MTNTAIRYTPEFKQTLIDLHQFKQLQKENRRLREELDILKRAAVLLAKRWIYSFLGRQANN
ncbi:hypothetical protein FAM6410_00517 [Lacticaseibacillus paracasei]|nr:hypothetical protein [Lacticaseibacillus paracasei]RNE03647.1 hypothetical protein FAM22276_00258 [Lacticaseibacillus paracasei]RNE38766.1 hypothetical protein FAM6410_00517 [Lacticaseibacillus paracasei]